MFEIYPNHRYEPLPHRAFLATGAEAARQPLAVP